LSLRGAVLAANLCVWLFALSSMAAAAGDASNPGETMVEAFGTTRSTAASNSTPKNSNPESKRGEGSSFLTRTMTSRVAPMHVEASSRNPYASSRNAHRSGRGHDFNGGGAGVGNGQLAQAQDRNFEACFERCRCAVRNIANVNPVYAVAAHKELQDLSAAPA
jgi:hypothetical protein